VPASGPRQPGCLKQGQAAVSKDHQTLGVIRLLISLGTLSVSAHRPLTGPSKVFVSASHSLHRSLPPFPPPYSLTLFFCLVIAHPRETSQGTENVQASVPFPHCPTALPQKARGPNQGGYRHILHDVFRGLSPLCFIYLDCSSLGSQTLLEQYNLSRRLAAAEVQMRRNYLSSIYTQHNFVFHQIVVL